MSAKARLLQRRSGSDGLIYDCSHLDCLVYHRHFIAGLEVELRELYSPAQAEISGSGELEYCPPDGCNPILSRVRSRGFFPSPGSTDEQEVRPVRELPGAA